ncbi:MAG: sel1 repeat family protein [Verrucomicrobia bacterium]|nr:sel1 repeat family protein [Verrucomicrobiota bacterium]
MRTITVLSLALTAMLFAPSVSGQGIRGVTRRTVGRPPTAPLTPPLSRPPSPAAPPTVVVQPPPVDPAKAAAAKEEQVRKTVEFQKKRAEQGSPLAQYDLGLRYLKGDGVTQSLDLAKHWFARAATNGNSMAARRLEELKKRETESQPKK